MDCKDSDESDKNYFKSEYTPPPSGVKLQTKLTTNALLKKEVRGSKRMIKNDLSRIEKE